MSQHHTGYVETLVHVNCGNCDGYWGLSDITVDDVANREFFCTHCGHEATLSELVRNE